MDKNIDYWNRVVLPEECAGNILAYGGPVAVKHDEDPELVRKLASEQYRERILAFAGISSPKIMEANVYRHVGWSWVNFPETEHEERRFSVDDPFVGNTSTGPVSEIVEREIRAGNMTRPEPVYVKAKR